MSYPATTAMVARSANRRAGAPPFALGKRRGGESEVTAVTVVETLGGPIGTDRLGRVLMHETHRRTGAPITVHTSVHNQSGRL